MHYLEFYNDQKHLVARLPDKLILENKTNGNRKVHEFFRENLSYKGSTGSKDLYQIDRYSLIVFLSSKELHFESLTEVLKELVKLAGEYLSVQYNYRPDTFLTGMEIRFIQKPRAYWLGGIKVKDSNGIKFYDYRNQIELRTRSEEQERTRKTISTITKIHPSWKTIEIWDPTT